MLVLIGSISFVIVFTFYLIYVILLQQSYYVRSNKKFIRHVHIVLHDIALDIGEMILERKHNEAKSHVAH